MSYCPTNTNARTDDETLLEQAKQLLSAGKAMEKRGDAAGAVLLYEQVQACGQSIKNVKQAQQVESAAVDSLGNAYKNMGQYERAIDHYTQAMALLLPHDEHAETVLLRASEGGQPGGRRDSADAGRDGR